MASTKIQAAMVREKGIFVVETAELNGPRDDEVLVRIVATGMCHTDLAMRNQDFPFPLPAVLGHEGAGIVERVGTQVTGLTRGDHVVLSFGSCGVCKPCTARRPAYCNSFMPYNFGGRRPDGTSSLHSNGEALASCFFQQSSFATHAVAHHRNAVKVSPELPLDVIAPIGCGIQTGAGAVMNVLRAVPGSTIVIFGMGAVGLAAVMAARLCDCASIIAVDLHASRRALARQLGATHTLDAASRDIVGEIAELTQGGADHSVEATGVPAVVSHAIMSLAPTGSAVLLGMMPGEATLTLSGSAFGPGKTVRGSIEGDSDPQEFIPTLLRFYAEGRLPIDKLISYYELADINAAASHSADGTAIKPVIRMPARSRFDS